MMFTPCQLNLRPYRSKILLRFCSERLDVQIFVQLACFGANETPKRRNIFHQNFIEIFVNLLLDIYWK